MTRIAVVGLGKLGSCMAAVFAAKGFRVTGVDTNPDTVAAVNAGRAPLQEPDLQDIITRGRQNLRATTRVADAVQNADVTFIVVPTPSEADGRFSLVHVREAARSVGEALRNAGDYHVVAVTSTVLPGSCEHGVLPVLEKASGKRCGGGFGLCYNPEFIALGSVISDFTHPDLVLIGESDGRAGDTLAGIYQRTCENAPEIARMSFASAELTKVALNSFVTTKISFANTLVAMCEALPGAHVDQVCRALGRDRRIGSRYLRGGLGYGGPCFPRDSVAFAAMARNLGQRAPIAEATDVVNTGVVDRTVEVVRRHAERGARVAVLGLAYKPGTLILERAQGAVIAQRLVAEGRSVTVFDRMATPPAAWGVAVAATPEDAIAAADVVVLTAADSDLAAVATRALARRGTPAVLIDCWRQVVPGTLPGVVRHVPLGVGATTNEGVERLKALWSEG